MRTALTIAGSDPTGGAGLQADLKVFRSFGVYGLSAVSAVTAQNTRGVEAVFPVERTVFEKQLNTLLSDIKPNAVKIGMLYSMWSAAFLVDLFSEQKFGAIVIDPVSVSSSGTSLVDEGTLDLIRTKLFPFSTIITPNIYEAALLTGIVIEEQKGMEEAARSLKSMGPDVVVITGGHLEGKAADLLYDGAFHIIEDEKIPGDYHGTGCAFSSAITALLALNVTPFESVRKAKAFVLDAMKKGYSFGRGMTLLRL